MGFKGVFIARTCFPDVTANFINLLQSPYHEGTTVTTLFHSCVQYVASNLQDYDLEDFPDEFVIKLVFSGSIFKTADVMLG